MTDCNISVDLGMCRVYRLSLPVTSTLFCFCFSSVPRSACESEGTGRPQSDCGHAYEESLYTALPLLGYIHCYAGMRKRGLHRFRFTTFRLLYLCLLCCLLSFMSSFTLLLLLLLT